MDPNSLIEHISELLLVTGGTLAGAWIGVKMILADVRTTAESNRSLPACDFSPKERGQKPWVTPREVENLALFLQRVFSSDEIRTLVHRTAGDDAACQLAGGCIREQVECAIAVLSRMREVDGEFFDYIREKRPKWNREVDALQRDWTDEVPR